MSIEIESRAIRTPAGCYVLLTSSTRPSEEHSTPLGCDPRNPADVYEHCTRLR
jgi:hypothetical protein